MGPLASKLPRLANGRLAMMAIIGMFFQAGFRLWYLGGFVIQSFSCSVT